MPSLTTPFGFNDQVKNTLYKDWTNMDAAQQDWKQYGGDKYYSYLKQGGSAFGDATPDRLGIDSKAQGELAAEGRQRAIQPAIDSYNATKPEITAKYDAARTQLEGQRQPLIDRYQVLLDSIKGNQTTAENRQTVTTNNELAKRGLSSDSGVSQQEMTNALNPITQQYTGLTKDTTLQREAGLQNITDTEANLTPQETADQRALTDAIAQLQANAGNQGVNDKLQLNASTLQQLLQQQHDAEAKREFDQNYALQQASAKQTTSPYQLISEGQSLINPMTGQLIYNQPKTYKQASGAVGGGAWG
jgi:hypothetical protein